MIIEYKIMYNFRGWLACKSSLTTPIELLYHQVLHIPIKGYLLKVDKYLKPLLPTMRVEGNNPQASLCLVNPLKAAYV